MNLRLIDSSGDEFVRAGVRAILAGARVRNSEIAVRGGADLSDPVTVSSTPGVPEGQCLVDLSAGMTTAPGDCAMLRNFAPHWRLITVQDRLARDVLADLGVDAPLLPCIAVHAWRLHPATVQPSGRHVALSAGMGKLTLALAAALKQAGLQPVLIAHGAATQPLADEPVLHSADYRDYFAFYGQCAGGITDSIVGAALLAGRGAPALAIGDDAHTRPMEEFALPRYRAEAAPDMLVERLISAMNDGTTRRRLVALERRSFRAHCELVRRAFGESDPAADDLAARLAAIRHRLSVGTDDAFPPPRERWIDPRPLLAFDGEEFIRECYLRVLGRSPDSEGLRHWTEVLATGTAKPECLMALASSEEARSRGVRLIGFPQSSEEFVQGLSCGQISPESVARWVELLESGKISRDEAARLIADSCSPERIVMAVADMRREIEWHRRAIEWLLPTDR